MADGPDINTVPAEYIPWLVAWDFGMLPDRECFHEFTDKGDGKYTVRLASFNVPSNIIFNLDASP